MIGNQIEGESGVAIGIEVGPVEGESANAGQAGSDGGNGQGCGMEDTGRGIGDRESPLFMHSWKGIMNKRRHAGERQADSIFITMK